VRSNNTLQGTRASGCHVFRHRPSRALSYEAESIDRALRDWCVENGIQAIEESAAQQTVPDPGKRASPARSGR